MSKILTVADIHLNDYPNRNPSNGYRLKQSRLIAQNIIKVAKQEGCDYIVFAGDIIEKSILRPYILAEVKLFLETVMANFIHGWIIFGNHDIDNKSADSNINDSMLGLMLPSNLEYAHQSIAEIDGIKLGFNNWQPVFDLTWIPDKVDVLFTHATICYNVSPEDGRLFKSQELDESKFDLAICGDIHRTGQIGKYISIGCTQKAKMGDSDESTGVVLDCSNKSWSWVNLNPDDNLMKFKNTDDLEKEGWDEETGTWYVYKQANTILDQTGKIKVDAWKEISVLVNKAIDQSGLQELHQTVLNNISNVDAGEVDFNFTLLHLHCENWRSIEVADVDFTQGDKILVQGSNGSGKTSLLSAIQYAFVDCGDTTGLVSLKPFVQFNKKDCLSEVEFLYQGNKYKIQRGTKTYGLWINDEPQKYSDKRMFEKDARDRFPFIKYMDAFIFNADRMSFLKSLSPERITEITSKFLKLNRIDTYHDTALLMYEQLKLQYSDWELKMKEVERLLMYINDKLSTITVPDVRKEVLEIKKKAGLELLIKNTEWNNFINSSAKLNATIEQTKTRLNDLYSEKKTFNGLDIIQKEIDQINLNLQEQQGKLMSLGNAGTEYLYKQQELDRLKAEGNKAFIEAKEISVGKTCSHCGQIIKTTDTMLKHKAELEARVEELKTIIPQLISEIDKLKIASETVDLEKAKIQSEITKLNHELSNRLVTIKHYQDIDNQIKHLESQLNMLNLELANLNPVEKVELPDNFMQEMSKIDSDLSTWDIYESNERDRLEKENEFKSYQEQVCSLIQSLKQLESYLKLTGPTGFIFEEIFNRLAEQFTNNAVKYTVERKGKGTREHLNLVPYFNNNGNWVNIFMCSSGQRIMLDLDYMNKIMSGQTLGLIVLDEFLKALDQEHAEIAIELIKDLNVNCILLTSHADSMPAFYNKIIGLNLNDSAKTEITIR